MAIAQNTTATGFSIGDIARSALSGLSRVFVSLMEANGYARQIEQLNAMSDEDLAKRGLTRDEIVRHVFRGRLFM